MISAKIFLSGSRGRCIAAKLMNNNSSMKKKAVTTLFLGLAPLRKAMTTKAVSAKIIGTFIAKAISRATLKRTIEPLSIILLPKKISGKR